MVGHKSYAAKLMQEIVENGKYKNLNDIKAALSKEGFQIDDKRLSFLLADCDSQHQKENFLSLKQWKDFKPIMNRSHMERSQERQQVTKSENAKHFAVVKLREGISGHNPSNGRQMFVGRSPEIPDKAGKLPMLLL